MKTATILPLLLTACSAEDAGPVPTNWLEFANKYAPWVFLIVLLWVLGR